VVIFHVAALWALQNGLLRRAAEAVVPEVIMTELISPPKPADPPPPPPPPPAQKREIVKAPPPPKPMAVREPRPALNAPVGTVEPPPPPAPALAPPAPPTPPAPPPAPATPKLVEVGESEVRYLREPQVNFPSMSRRLGESGLVIVSVYFNSEGVPKKAEIFKSSGFDRLDQAAREAVMNSRVTPIRRPGADESTVYMFKAPINFKLAN